MILKVADLSSEQCFAQLDAVNEVLLDLKAIEKPFITVFNKIDQMDKTQVIKAKNQYPDGVFVSALNNLKIHELRDKILDFLENYKVSLNLSIPIAKMNDIVELRKHATITNEHYEGEDALIECVMEKPKWNRLEEIFNKYIAVES